MILREQSNCFYLQLLTGHPGFGTITIVYSFQSGTQTADMPNPGQRYYAQAFPRYAYLPDSPEGRKVSIFDKFFCWYELVELNSAKCNKEIG